MSSHTILFSLPSFPSFTPHHLPLTTLSFPNLLPISQIFVFLLLPSSLHAPLPLLSRISHDAISRAMSAIKSPSILHPIRFVRFIARHTAFNASQSESISTMARSRNEMSGCAVHLFFDFEFVKWIHFAVRPPRNRCQQCE